MAFWKEMLLVYVLGLQGISSQEGESADHTPKPSLYCHQCLSEISWDDCNMRSKKAPCEENHVCLTVSVQRWDMTNGTKTGRVLHIYAKYCDEAGKCSDKQCKELGWRCQVKCCSEHMCNGSNHMDNGSNIIWLNMILFVVVHGSAIHSILTAY